MAAPLHRTLAAELRRRIRSGAIGIGESLPSEAQLCREFAASRGPVRQALAALRDEGLIGGGQGKRPVVLDAVPAQPFESFQSFTRRAELTGHVPGQRLQEIALRRPEPAVAAALQLDDDTPAVQLLRLRLLDGRPAMLERMTYVESVGRALLDADLDAGSIYALLTSHGVDLHAARHTFDAVAADATDSALLEVPVGSPLLRERRLTSDSSGRPLEWSDDRYRSDVATVTVTNTRSSRAPVTRL
ncbi:GntR family transcriptional regulator [Pseudonocardia abyssalis]|jgi:GntR family transcriptional regulator|uniref:GntR family transcriptional regulator n=1 Tax=Pseudonocardia abyssalis TaxID=2792008 RepID=A0ABS6UU71_9PSEU|nr:GntR family transcriptional regulator [Pseudonocardia abyssalis]MBW0119109.1 GntR family transcriptional regulator [Pseudonocardia abyssalis]MBW0135314.1 GntR family transcriptional regulator [Pseudonocardia abyssalis]